MILSASLNSRCDEKCELCTAQDKLYSFAIAPHSDDFPDHNVVVCQQCHERLNDSSTVDPNHWRCLNDSMWSQVPAVQVIVWRLLNQLNTEPWAQDLLDMLYLEDDTLAWAKTAQTRTASRLLTIKTVMVHYSMTELRSHSPKI